MFWQKDKTAKGQKGKRAKGQKGINVLAKGQKGKRAKGQKGINVLALLRKLFQQCTAFGGQRTSDILS